MENQENCFAKTSSEAIKKRFSRAAHWFKILSTLISFEKKTYRGERQEVCLRLQKQLPIMFGFYTALPNNYKIEV